LIEGRILYDTGSFFTVCMIVSLAKQDVKEKVELLLLLGRIYLGHHLVQEFNVHLII
jgi:hypothetical protein